MLPEFRPYIRASAPLSSRDLMHWAQSGVTATWLAILSLQVSTCCYAPDLDMVTWTLCKHATPRFDVWSSNEGLTTPLHCYAQVAASYVTRGQGRGLSIRNNSIVLIYMYLFWANILADFMFRIVFWDIMPCRMIVDRRFRGAYCLHHQKTILNIIPAAIRTWNLILADFFHRVITVFNDTIKALNTCNV
jgi:hypothetical protein